MATALYLTSEIRKIEKAAKNYLLSRTQLAGATIADFVLDLLKTKIISSNPLEEILVVVGPGQNGRDGLEAACYLANANLPVSILLSKEPQYFATCEAYQRLLETKVTIESILTKQPCWQNKPKSLVIDALFGTGLCRPITGQLAELVTLLNKIHQAGCPTLSLDVPSGLDADTGNIVGQDKGIAIQASNTITFIGDKPGLHTAFGKDYAGTIKVVTLGIPNHYFLLNQIELNAPDLFTAGMRPRLHNSHKGIFGKVIVVASEPSTIGAPILAAKAALQMGAGKVFIQSLTNTEALSINIIYPQLIVRCGNQIEHDDAVWVVGPGLGISETAFTFLDKILETPLSLLLDADALHIIAKYPALKCKLRQRKAISVLTPHPLEAARLLATSTEKIQQDRINAAKLLAKEFQSIVVVKGSGSIIANAKNHCIINSTGNPGLATAGSGDILAGACAALLAQGWPTWEAILAAVWIHGSAAEYLVSQGVGPIGLTVEEIIPAMRFVLNQHLVFSK